MCYADTGTTDAVGDREPRVGESGFSADPVVIVMTRHAAKSGFETFLGAAVEATREEFSVGRALRGTGFGLGGSVVDRLRGDVAALERRVVEPELDAYRADAMRQFDVVLDYAAGGESIDAYAAELLARDGYYEALDDGVSDRTATAVRDAIIERNRRLGDAVRPIVDRPETEFWTATTAALSEDEAVELVEDAFPFTGVLREYPDAFTFEVRIDPGTVLGGPLAGALPDVSVEYTDEARRAMRRAERRVIEETKRELAARFDNR